MEHWVKNGLMRFAAILLYEMSISFVQKIMQSTKKCDDNIVTFLRDKDMLVKL